MSHPTCDDERGAWHNLFVYLDKARGAKVRVKREDMVNVIECDKALDGDGGKDCILQILPTVIIVDRAKFWTWLTSHGRRHGWYK